MIVLIDNYDSFSYNVYQLIGSVEPDIKVVRNDEYTVEEIEAMKPEALILSPGPGKPSDAGICIEAIKYFAGKLPIFGICLGHQAICEAFGGRVSYAKELMHGKKKIIYTVGESKLFEGLGDSFQAARYHSLAAGNGLHDADRKTDQTSDKGTHQGNQQGASCPAKEGCTVVCDQINDSGPIVCWQSTAHNTFPPKRVYSDNGCTEIASFIICS